MPRTARASQANYCYHVLNRGNARAQVFHKPADYTSFVDLIEAACQRRPMRVLGYCLMPNHFHLVLWPIADGDLGTWMQWLMTSHVRRYHRHYHSSGHVWQGRFKAFPIEEDDHLRLVLRYVERNPLRAGLVGRAEDWAWSSLRPPSVAVPTWLDPGPAPRGEGWAEEVNRIATTDDQLERLRRSVNRGSPFGSEAWAARAADVLGLRRRKGDILVFPWEEKWEEKGKKRGHSGFSLTPHPRSPIFSPCHAPHGPPRPTTATTSSIAATPAPGLP